MLVSATDFDSGDNGEITFEITADGNGSAYMDIDPNNGLISTTVTSSPAADNIYVIIVLVKDKGIHVLTSTATVVFNVLAEDSEFEFTNNDIKYDLEEGKDPHVFLELSSLLSNTSNANIVYEIPGSDPGLPFRVDSNTGRMSLVSELDREKKATYYFPVRAHAGTASTLALVSYIIPHCFVTHLPQTMLLIEDFMTFYVIFIFYLW